MEWYDIEPIRSRTVTFNNCNQSVPGPANGFEADDSQDVARANLGESHTIGGIMNGGKWAWLVKKPGDTTLQIISLWNGSNVCKYKFEISRNNEHQKQYSVRHVEELYFGGDTECTILAVCLEADVAGVYDAEIESHIALYSMRHNCQFHCIELQLRVSCLKSMDIKSCRRTLFQNYDGCLAVGSDEGVLLLLDLNIEHRLAEFEALVESKQNSSSGIDSHIGCAPAQVVNYSEKISDVIASFRKCRDEDLNFGLCLEAIDAPCAITSLLPLDVVLGLAAGTADGRIVLYDLTEMFFISVAEPPITSELPAAVGQMCCLVPPDDPRPCFYICALYNDGESLYTALYAFMYEKRIEEEEQVFSFANFHTHICKLRLYLENSPSIVIGCQSISKLTGNNDAISICVISWYSVLEDKNKVLIFDLNQWYKEQMPHGVVGQKNPTYLAGYILSGLCRGINVKMIPKSIAHFNSLQRYEEHFYPNSLSFDCFLLIENGCRLFKWVGAQNRFINLLRIQNSTIFLDPRPYHEEIIRTRLLPQFCEQNRDSTFSKSAMYELILSVALENNCINLLRDCARSWLDGSFMCNFSIPTEISLSTLTNWIFKRANQIKNRCNEICQGVFQTDSYPLDDRERKELRFISRQLSLLSELENDILKQSEGVVPTDAFKKLEDQKLAIRLATDYQELLNWMLSIGLLPEQPENNFADYEFGAIIGAPYPVTKLRQIYIDKRTFFEKISNHFMRPKIGSCRLLFIDVILHQNNEENLLIEYWPKSKGLYPPASIEELLHIMLVPDLDYQQKCAVILYFLLDLNMLLEHLTNKHIVSDFIKFHSVFKLSASLVKTVEAFWSLDHGHFVMSVEQFLSPVNNVKQSPLWQVELMIEALITQKSNSLALGILETHIGAVSPLLRLKTLLANDMISEAFQLARAKEFDTDKSLVEIFFASCVHASKFDVLRDLVISDKEEQILQRVLRECKTPGVERVHFAYLLQKSKYLEAVSYMDELSQNRASSNLSSSSSTCNNGNYLSPNLMLTAYNTTMPPVQQSLTDIYFRIRNKIRLKEIKDFQKAPEPFSSQLIKQNANSLLGGIYHSTALSAHFATYYWGDLDAPTNSQNNDDDNAFPAGRDPMSTTNAPFLRKPQNETNHHNLLARLPVSHPVPYVPAKKRKHEIETDLETEKSSKTFKNSDHPRKRRRLLAERFVDNMTHFVNEKLGDSSALSNNNNNMLNIGDSIDTVQLQSVLKEPIPSNSPQKTASREVLSGSPLSGILKPDIKASSIQPETLKDPEKNIRFDLTNIKDSDELMDDELKNTELQKNIRFDLTNIEDSDELMDGELRNTKLHASTSGITSTDNLNDLQNEFVPSTKELTVNREVTETVSASSSRRSSISLRSTSENEFYSPINSAHTSLAIQPITEEFTDEKSNEEDKSSIELGPKPRPSLRDVHIAMQNESQENSKEQLATISQSLVSCRSSGFGSSNSRADIETTESTLNTVQLMPVSTSLNVAQSKMNEFVPMVCSSKVCATQSKFVQRDIAKISECTTIVGSFNSEISITRESQIDDSESNEAVSTTLRLSNTDSQVARQRMLDTTMDMSTEDFTSPESLQSESLQQTVIVPNDVFDVDENESRLHLQRKELDVVESEADNIVNEVVDDIIESLPIEDSEKYSMDSSAANIVNEVVDDLIESLPIEDNEKYSMESEVISISNDSDSIDSDDERDIMFEVNKHKEKNCSLGDDINVASTSHDVKELKLYTSATSVVEIDSDNSALDSYVDSVSSVEELYQLKRFISHENSLGTNTEQNVAEESRDSEDNVFGNPNGDDCVVAPDKTEKRIDGNITETKHVQTHDVSAAQVYGTEDSETDSVITMPYDEYTEQQKRTASPVVDIDITSSSNDDKLSIKSKSSIVVNDTVEREDDNILLRYTSSSSSSVGDEMSNSSLTVVTENAESIAPSEGDVKENQSTIHNEDTDQHAEKNENEDDSLPSRSVSENQHILRKQIESIVQETASIDDTGAISGTLNASNDQETASIDQETASIDQETASIDNQTSVLRRSALVKHNLENDDTGAISGTLNAAIEDAAGIDQETASIDQETESIDNQTSVLRRSSLVKHNLENDDTGAISGTLNAAIEDAAGIDQETASIDQETASIDNQTSVLRRSSLVKHNLENDDTGVISGTLNAAIEDAAGINQETSSIDQETASIDNQTSVLRPSSLVPHNLENDDTGALSGTLNAAIGDAAGIDQSTKTENQISVLRRSRRSASVPCNLENDDTAAISGTLNAAIGDAAGIDQSTKTENQISVLRRSRRSASVPHNLENDDTGAISGTLNAAIGDAAGTPIKQRRYSLRASSNSSISAIRDTPSKIATTPVRKRATRPTDTEPEQEITEPRLKRGSSVPLMLPTNTPQSGLRKRALQTLEVISETNALLTPTTRSRRRLISGGSDAENVSVSKPKRRFSLTTAMEDTASQATPTRQSLRRRSTDIKATDCHATESETKMLPHTIEETTDNTNELNDGDEKPVGQRTRLRKRAPSEDETSSVSLRTRRQQRATSEAKMDKSKKSTAIGSSDMSAKRTAAATTTKQRGTPIIEDEGAEYESDESSQQSALSEAKMLSNDPNNELNDNSGDEKTTTAALVGQQRTRLRQRAPSVEQVPSVSLRTRRQQRATSEAKMEKSKKSTVSGSSDGSTKRTAASTTTKQRNTPEVSTIVEDEGAEYASDETDSSLKSSRQLRQRAPSVEEGPSVSLRTRRQQRAPSETKKILTEKSKKSTASGSSDVSAKRTSAAATTTTKQRNTAEENTEYSSDEADS